MAARHRTVSSQIALITRHHGADDPRLPALREDLAALGAVSTLARWAEVAAQLPRLDPGEVAQVGAIAARLDSRISVRQGDGADAA